MTAPSDGSEPLRNGYSDHHALADRDWIVTGEPITAADMAHGVFPVGKPTKICEPLFKAGDLVPDTATWPRDPYGVHELMIQKGHMGAYELEQRISEVKTENLEPLREADINEIVRIVVARRAILLENAVDRLLSEPNAVQRMIDFLVPRAYLPPPFDVEALVRNMLEAAKVPKGE